LAGVPEFPYLGSTITSDGEVDTDVRIRIVANAFGSLRKSIFTSQSLSVDVKHAVYKAVVLATLLYGSEYWAVKAYQYHVTHH